MFIIFTCYYAFIILNEIVKIAPKFLELATGVKIIFHALLMTFLGIHQMAPLCYKQQGLTSAFQYRDTFAKALILEMSILK